MIFDGLTNEAKLLFVIYAGEPSQWTSQVLKLYYEAGGSQERSADAWNEFVSFLHHCRQASFEERRHRKDHQRKVEARIRA